MTQAATDSILVIDDTPMVCGMIAHTLSELPFRVLTADSVRTARLLFDQIGQIRMMLVDLGLPDGSGLEIIDEARKLRPNMPILLMSGYDVAGLEVDFILKPFDPEELLARVELMAY